MNGKEKMAIQEITGLLLHDKEYNVVWLATLKDMITMQKQ